MTPRSTPTIAWRDGERDPGDAVAVDIDGVLSDGGHRQHFLDRSPQDWRGFFDASADDPPLADQVRLVETLRFDHTIALVTARPDHLREATVSWLAEHDIRWDALVMRASTDYGPSPEMKQRAVDLLGNAGHRVVLALDDDRRNVAMYRSVGIPCVYIHSGYYEA